MKTKTKKRLFKCQDCDKKDKTVTRDVCPYNDDVHGKQVKANLCAKCHNERAADI